MQDFASEVSRTRRAADRYLTHELARCGLEGLVPSHGDILAQLFLHEPMRMSDLSARIGRDPSTTTALVRKLTRLGLAQTGRDDQDRRAIVVSLTPEGRRWQEPFGHISEGLRACWNEGVDPEDLAVAVRVLKTVCARLEARDRARDAEPVAQSAETIRA